MNRKNAPGEENPPTRSHRSRMISIRDVCTWSHFCLLRTVIKSVDFGAKHISNVWRMKSTFHFSYLFPLNCKNGFQIKIVFRCKGIKSGVWIFFFSKFKSVFLEIGKQRAKTLKENSNFISSLSKNYKTKS